MGLGEGFGWGGGASEVWIGFHRGAGCGLQIMFTVCAMDGRGAIRIFALNRRGRKLE